MTTYQVSFIKSFQNKFTKDKINDGITMSVIV